MALSKVQVFELFLPKEYIESILIPETNTKIEGPPLLYGEFLQWIELQLVMATIQGFQRRDFWASKAIDTYETAPYRFNDIMSQRRFESILSAIKYTDEDPPSYMDPFWEIQKLLKAWNDNMAENFTPSWTSCLDESMMKWLNQYTCPGFMFVPRKL